MAVLTKRTIPGATAQTFTPRINVAAYATGGSGTTGSPWTGWATRCPWAADTVFEFQDGYYAHAASLDLAYRGIVLDGPGATLRYTGTTGAGEAAVLISSTETNNLLLPFDVRFNIRQIDANGADNGLLLQGCHDSDIRTAIINARRSKAVVRWCVGLTGVLDMGGNRGDPITTPSEYGLRMLGGAGGSSTAANLHLIISQCSIAGLYLEDTVFCKFTGYSALNTGKGVLIAEASWNNAFTTFDCEVNTDGDWDIAASGTSLLSCVSTSISTIRSTARGVTLHGGRFRSLTIEAGASGRATAVRVGYTGEIASPAGAISNASDEFTFDRACHYDTSGASGTGGTRTYYTGRGADRRHAYWSQIPNGAVNTLSRSGIAVAALTGLSIAGTFGGNYATLLQQTANPGYAVFTCRVASLAELTVSADFANYADLVNRTGTLAYSTDGSTYTTIATSSFLAGVTTLSGTATLAEPFSGTLLIKVSITGAVTTGGADAFVGLQSLTVTSDAVAFAFDVPTSPGGSSGQLQKNDGAGGFAGFGSTSGNDLTLPGNATLPNNGFVHFGTATAGNASIQGGDRISVVYQNGSGFGPPFVAASHYNAALTTGINSLGVVVATSCGLIWIQNNAAYDAPTTDAVRARWTANKTVTLDDTAGGAANLAVTGQVSALTARLGSQTDNFLFTQRNTNYWGWLSSIGTYPISMYGNGDVEVQGALSAASITTTTLKSATGSALNIVRNTDGFVIATVADGDYGMSFPGPIYGGGYGIRSQGGFANHNGVPTTLYNLSSLPVVIGASSTARTDASVEVALPMYCLGALAAASLNLGGATVLDVLSATASLDFGNTSAQSSADLTITVTGAAVGDTVIVAPPAAPDANTSFTGYVSAADTVTVRFNNYSSGSVNPASGTYRASVIKV